MTSKWEQASAKHRHKKNAVIALLFLGFLMGCVWRFTRLHNTLGFATLLGWGEAVHGYPWATGEGGWVFFVGGLTFFFPALLSWVNAFSFDPPHAAHFCSL